MGTRTITDTLRYLVDPWASQSVVFTLLSPIASVDGLYLPRSLTATTDVTGAFSIALPVPDDADEAGAYTCLLPNGLTIPFPLSAGVGSVRLGSLFVEAISTASPNDLQVLIDNHAAVKASTTVLGHVTVDGTTITATNGVLSAAGGGGGAPTNATYVTLSTNATLTGERVLTAGDNVTLTDNGAGGTVVVAAPAVATSAALAAHEADTTAVHGIANTAALVLTSDSRLSDSRTPTAHAASHVAAGSDPLTLSQAQVTSLVSDLAAKAPLASPALTGTPTAPTASAGTNTTQLATTAFATGGLATHEADTTAVHGIANTATLLTTSTAAGGVLGGTYPNPTFAADMATQAELDSEAVTRAAADTALDARVDVLELDPGYPVSSGGTVFWTIPTPAGSVANSTTPLTVGSLEYEPFIVPFVRSFDRIAIMITSAAAAGKLVRLALYAATTTWQPGALIVDSGNLAADSTGIKEATISITLQPGRYLKAKLSDGTPTCRFWYVPTPGGVWIRAAAGSGSSIGYIYKTGVAYGAYPLTGTAWDTDAGDQFGFPHVVLLRPSA